MFVASAPPNAFSPCRLWSTCGECVEMAAIAYAVFGAFLDAYHESLRAEFPLSVAFFPAMTEDCSLQVRTGADPPDKGEDQAAM